MPRRRITLWALVIVVVAVAAALCWRPWSHPTVAVEGMPLASFPAVATDGLSPARRQVIDVLRAEFDAQHPGPYYAQGDDEPWCADFVSWIMRAAGSPLENPNSGSWRIPGVATLQDFYESTGRFHPANSGYLPQASDVVIYADASPFHQHTNIVLDYAEGVMTTIGGNEPSGIAIHRFTLADDPGVVGFGVL